MNDRLTRTLTAFVEKNRAGISTTSVRYVEISDNGCGEEPTLDLTYRNQAGQFDTWEVLPHEVADFLTFLVEFER